MFPQVVVEPNPEKGIRAVASDYGSNDSVLDVRNSFGFTVRNVGTVAAYLYGTIELLPGQQIPFDNVAGLPYAENAQLSFANVSGTKKLRVVKWVVVPYKFSCET